MSDIRRVAVGDEGLWRNAVASILSEQDREGQLVTESELTSALADPCCLLFVALSGESPVGLLSAYIVPDVSGGGRLAYLYDIEVLTSHRRSSIGTALVEALAAACRTEGVKTIWAGTDVQNHAARRTFERTGADLAGDSYVEYEWEL